MTIKDVLPEVSKQYARGYEYARRCHEEQAGAECMQWLREMIHREPATDFDTGVRDYMVAHGLVIVEAEKPALITEESPAGRIAVGLLLFGVAIVGAARLLGLL